MGDGRDGGTVDGRVLVLGLGCERGTPSADVLALAGAALERGGYPGIPLSMVASLESRASEPAMMSVAEHFSVPLETFSAARLEAETARLITPSDTVYRHTGCHGVAEAAALAVGGKAGILVVPKMKSARATAAVVLVEIASNQCPGDVFSRDDSLSSQVESTPGPAA